MSVLRRLRTRLFPPSGPWYRRWWLALTAGGLAVAVVLAVGGLFTVFYARASIPDPGELIIPEPTVVYDNAGNRVATLDPAAVRENVSLDALPDHVWQAVLAAEDRQFYDHIGFSFEAIGRAFWDNVTSGDRLEGGSTITQQYVEVAVRDVALTYVGKLREVAYATKLERRLTKDDILQRYLNAVPFGRGTVGIEAAAQTYFETSARDLNVNQAATLAGMIAAPTRFSPARNPDGARQRRDYVLRGMNAKGWVGDQRAEQLRSASLPQVTADPVVQFGPNAYFLDAVRGEVKERFGQGRDVFTGLEIHTTLDPRMQRLALERLRQHLSDVPYTGAVVSVDPGTGGVFALVGGLDFSSQQFNTATQARRQAGSAFKAFTLSTFVKQGRSPQAVYPAPAEIEISTPNGPYQVSNFAREGFGDADVRAATLNSINTVYAQIQQDVGTDNLVTTAHDLGIRGELPAVPSLTLGTAGVTPLEMANAFATLAGGGEESDAHFVRRVVDRTDDEVLSEREQGGQRAVEPNVAAVVTDILRANVESGTGTAAQIDRPAAGKTGTTQDFRDAWFVGYVPQLATAVWVGNLEEDSPMDGVTGGSIPAQVWGDYMQAALAGQQVVDFPEPDYGPLEAETTAPPDAGPTATTPPPSPTVTPSPTPSRTSPSPTTTGGPTLSPRPTRPASPTASGDGLLPEPTPSESSGSPSPEPSDESTEGQSEPTREPSPTPG